MRYLHILSTQETEVFGTNLYWCIFNSYHLKLNLKLLLSQLYTSASLGIPVWWCSTRLCKSSLIFWLLIQVAHRLLKKPVLWFFLKTRQIPVMADGTSRLICCRQKGHIPCHCKLLPSMKKSGAEQFQVSFPFILVGGFRLCSWMCISSLSALLCFCPCWEGSAPPSACVFWNASISHHEKSKGAHAPISKNPVEFIFRILERVFEEEHLRYLRLIQTWISEDEHFSGSSMW